MLPIQPPTARQISGDDRGAVLVEYMSVFGFVIIVLTIAIVKVGPQLLADWDDTRALLLANKP